MSRIRNLALLFSLLVLASNYNSPVQAQFVAENAQPVPAGARVNLEPTKSRYFLGENIVAHFSIENAGTEPFKVVAGGDYRFAARHMRLKVTAADSEGNPVADPYPATFNMGGLIGEQSVKPGGSWFNTFSLLPYCRFEKPGIYQISAQYDAGWKVTPDHPLPIAKAQIELVMPSLEEARAIVAELDTVAENTGVTIGEKNVNPMRDYGALSYPLYLPLLLERIDAGNLKYLPSVAGIETLEATRAMVERLKSPKPTADAVAVHLERRLPVFSWRPYFLANNEQAAKNLREKLVSAAWRDEFVPTTRAYAINVLKSTPPSDRETLRIAASILENIGTAQDLPVVLGALNRRISSTVRLPRWDSINYKARDHDGWLFQDDCLTLMCCASALVRRGAALPPASATNPATIAVQLSPTYPLQGQPTTMPIKWLRHPIPFIRQLTLEKLTTTSSQEQKITLNSEVRALIPSLLKDSDISVRVATCNLVGKSGDKRLLPQVLKVFSSAHHRSEIDAAQSAAQMLGGQYQVWEIWANRLDEKDMLQPAIESLCQVIDNNRGTGWRYNENGTEGKVLKPRWQQFLKANRVRLEQNRRFSKEEAVWAKDLFPKQLLMG